MENAVQDVVNVVGVNVNTSPAQKLLNPCVDLEAAIVLELSDVTSMRSVTIAQSKGQSSKSIVEHFKAHTKINLESALSPWCSRLGSNRQLCLTDTAVRDEISHFVTQLNPEDRYTLALIYMPGSSIAMGDHFDNSTSRLVFEPILGRKYFTVEFLDLAIPHNAWVDLTRVRVECKNADSWMVRDYVNRVSNIINYKQVRGLSVDLFVGGPDA